MPRLARALGALLLTLGASPLARAQADAAPETRAVWVLDNRVSTPAAAEATFKELAAAGINLAYVRVLFAGGTLYPSAVVAAAGGPRQVAAHAGKDPLADALAAGRRHGVRVGAWMEYGLAERITAATTQAPPILAAHPDWAMVDRAGKTYVDHGNGTRSYWMDPGNAAVRAFVRDLFVELVTQYPDLAAVEYDRFRYPDLSWSYAPATVARYRAETGQGDPLLTSDGYGPWVTWREAQTTRLAGEVYRAVKAANPAVLVTAAVVPPYMLEGAQDKMQDWPTWADSGYVDALDPMLYANDRDFPLMLAAALGRLRRPDGTRKVPVYAGVSAENGSLLGQLAEARRQGVEGVTIWYDGALSSADYAALRSGPFAQTVLPTFDDLRVDDGDARGFALEGTWVSEAGYRGTSRTLREGAGSAVWRLGPVRAGTYDLYVRWQAGPDRAENVNYQATVVGPSASVPGSTFFYVNQRQASGWTRGAAALRLGPSDSVHVRLGGPRSPGTINADAVRLVRVQPMRAEEVLAQDSTTVLVRFTYPVYAPAPSSFLVDGEPVARVAAQADRRILRLTPARPLARDVTYALTVRDVRSDEGYRLDPAPSTVSFRRGTDLERVVDEDRTEPGVTAFTLTGAWGTGPGGHDGSAYRTATTPTTARALWTNRVATSGAYDVEVYLPDGSGAAGPLTYLVLSQAGTDTVQVWPRIGWARVGTYSFEAGTTAALQLTGALSGGGVLVADAARWRRTLTPTAVEPEARERPVADFALGAPYPNPARDRVALRVRTGGPGRLALDVYDVLGRRVLATERPAPTGEADVVLDAAGLPAGAYLVRARFTPAAGAARTATAVFTRLD